MTDTLPEFNARNQRLIRHMLSEDVLAYVNAAVMLAYPGGRRFPLNTPIPDRTCQVAILAAWLAVQRLSPEDLLERIRMQDVDWAAAIYATRVAAQADYERQTYAAKTSREENTARLLASLTERKPL